MLLLQYEDGIIEDTAKGSLLLAWLPDIPELPATGCGAENR